MSKRWIIPCIVLATLALLAVATTWAGSPVQEPSVQTETLGSMFTYQGQLNLDGQPVDNTCTFQFTLYDDELGNVQVGATQTVSGVQVAGGLFAVQLDFGADAFQGDARWLGIEVQCQGDTGYADLGLQALTAAPYALYALGVPWDGITDMPAGFADGVDDDVLASLSCDNGQIAEWDGSAWLCGDDDVGSGGGEGDITAVYAGYGLAGGGESGDVALNVLTHTIQSRVAESCLAGSSIRVIHADGTVECEEDDIGQGGGGGDITAVLPGEGLVGGALSGTATLTVAFSGSGVATTAARSDHNHDGTYSLVGHTHPGEDITSPVDEALSAAYASTAGDADTLDGEHADAFADVSHTHPGEDIISPVAEAISATWALTATYASAAGEADTLDGQHGDYYLDWSNLTDVPPGFADGIDNDTTYTVGIGLALTGTQFSITPTYRLPQSCAGGQIAEWDGAAWVCGTDDDTTSFWSLSGNAGTDPSVHFLGTTDAVSLTLAVNGAPALRIVPYFRSGYGWIPSIIGGYSGNEVAPDVWGATIGGGGMSGYSNRVTGEAGTVSGGYKNTASGWAPTIGGGIANTAAGGSWWGGATVGGGELNTASADYATVGGGHGNTASGVGSSVGGGGYNGSDFAGNTAEGTAATVGGGYDNAASGNSATVGGGQANSASGFRATVPGGYQNTAAGAYSLATGRRAQANNQGCFVWGDSTNADVVCDNNNRWVARASGGVYFYTSSDLSTGAYLAPGSETWQQVSASDRALKENLAPVDSQEILARLADVPITTWNYKASETGARHISPMAQDFYAAFGVGEDNKHLSALDTNGVALAAIQGLYTQNQALQQQVNDLEARLSALESGNSAGLSVQAGLLPGASVLLAGILGLWLVRRREEER